MASESTQTAYSLLKTTQNGPGLEPCNCPTQQISQLHKATEQTKASTTQLLHMLQGTTSFAEALARVEFERATVVRASVPRHEQAADKAEQPCSVCHFVDQCIQQ